MGSWFKTRGSKLFLGCLVFSSCLFLPFLLTKSRITFILNEEDKGNTYDMYKARKPQALQKDDLDFDINQFLSEEKTPQRQSKASVPTSKYPPSVTYALSDHNTTGYLLGNSTHLEFHPYEGGDVDLRIIVIVYDRAESLYKCLSSLNEAVFEDDLDVISLEIWIDRSTEGIVNQDTLQVAIDFKFIHGTKYVHIQKHHVGIQGQWTNTWRPRIGSKEIGLILEDDVDVSWYFWRWLKAAHHAYHGRKYISGYGLSHPGMAHKTGDWLDIPLDIHTYLYRVICTWGYSPDATSWRHYQEWFYQQEQNSTFLPLVPGILPTKWFLSERKKGKGRNLWEIWHICYTHFSNPTQYTVMLNTPHEGLLAVNRHETGLHDSGGVPRELLCVHWKDSYLDFPDNPPRFGYDGNYES